MIDLRSEPRRALLAYYFTNPQASHYLRELAGLLRLDPANLSRELARLEAEGLFVSERRGRQKYFRLNRGYPLYEEMRRIVFKTVGVAGRLRKAFKEVPGVKEAWLYGSFAQDRQDAASDIDILIVGEPKAEKLERAIRKLEREFGREINYTSMTPREFQSRRRRKDAFLEDVWRHKKISLVPSP
jgi:predicted nucleotidyltransferase